MLLLLLFMIIVYILFHVLQQFPSRSLRSAAMSETRLSEVNMLRPSSSSTEEESINDSNSLLLPKSSKNRAKAMTRAVSSDVV